MTLPAGKVTLTSSSSVRPATYVIASRRSAVSVATGAGPNPWRHGRVSFAAGAGHDDPALLVVLEPHERAGRPLGGDVAGQVEHAVLAHHGVLGAAVALRADPAALHRDRAREGRGHLGLVGDDDDRGAEVVAEGVDQVQHVVAVGVAELAGRLVGEQQPRGGRDRAGEGEALALAAGHRGDHLVGLVDEPDPVEQLGVGQRVLALVAGQREPGEGDVLAGGGVGQEVAGGALQHGRDLARADPGEVALAHPGDLLVAEEDLAGAGLLDAAEQREQRRLARAAGAQERDALARADGQVDAAQRDDVVPAEGLVEVDDTLAADAESPGAGLLDRGRALPHVPPFSMKQRASTYINCRTLSAW